MSEGIYRERRIINQLTTILKKYQKSDDMHYNSIEIYTVPGMHVWQTNEKRKIRKEKKNDKYIIYL